MSVFVPTEDTMPPSHFHEMGPVRTITGPDGIERREIEWIPIVDLETAREIVTHELHAEMCAAHPLTAEAKTIADNAAKAIEQARDLDTLIAIDIAVPGPPIADRTHPRPTQIEYL